MSVSRSPISSRDKMLSGRPPLRLSNEVASTVVSATHSQASVVTAMELGNVSELTTSNDEGNITESNDHTLSTPGTTRNKRLKRKERSGDATSPEISTEQYQRDMAAIRKLLEVKVKEDDEHRAETSKEIRGVKETCSNLEVRVSTVEEDIDNRFEREARKCDVVLRGIPINERARESEHREIVLKLADHLGVELHNRHIVFTHRLAIRADDRGVGSLLVVRLRDEGIRRRLMMAFIQAKEVSINVLGFEAGGNITISDNLTKKDAVIRKRAIELKFEGALKQVSVRGGAICVTLPNETRRHNVHSIAHLEQIAVLGKVHNNPFKRKNNLVEATTKQRVNERRVDRRSKEGSHGSVSGHIADKLHNISLSNPNALIHNDS